MPPDKSDHHLLNSHWVIIVGGWFATQIILFTIYGINSREEALTHLSFAENFLDGTVKFDLHRLWYAGYTTLLIVVRKLGLPYESMYGVQLILSFVSLIYFVRIISLWTTSKLTLIFSGLMYSTCFLIHQWVNYLFTDAVFAFLLVISIYYLLSEDKSRRNQVVFWCLLIVLPFFRPVGFLFVAVAWLHWIFSFKRQNLKKIVLASAYLSVLIYMVHQSIVINRGYFYPYNHLDAEIICRIPSNLLQYQVVPYTRDTKIVEYFWNNPEMSARLFSYRFYKTFSLTRSYFSSGHNFIIATACIVYYALALIGAYYVLARRLSGRYFLIVGCLIYCVPTVAFCVEWHGRTSVPVLCFILLLASLGVDRIVQRVGRDV
jgi:hypothetical protein